ncbi:MAG: hypothetical protein A4E62_01476 [Syntrophorhabdus sp. PtaU1.Bin002]|nr:MAG: hypothetical protein A4E62_01476 [Syntrophorhabdus sp. PtaU1.Bin002]
MEFYCSIHPCYNLLISTRKLICRDQVLDIPCLLLLVEFIHAGKDTP